MEIRNANLTAKPRLSPAINPPNSVDPDLDTPGHIAMPLHASNEDGVSELHVHDVLVVRSRALCNQEDRTG